jgi:hypothetical protein
MKQKHIRSEDVPQEDPIISDKYKRTKAQCDYIKPLFGNEI